jgi:RNA polymerase sigma-70 factor (ECF subfamily)
MNASSPVFTFSAESAPASAPALGTDELFRKHAPFVARMLVRMGVPGDAIDDAVQEVFLAVHRQGGYRPGPAKPTTYLANLALHAASAHHRRQRIRRARESDVPADETAATTSDAAAEFELGESLLRLSAALDRMDPSLRATLVLAEIEGETCPSIAASMSVPVGTVYWRLHRARKELRSALKRIDAASPPRRWVAGEPNARPARREHALAFLWLAPTAWAKALGRASAFPAALAAAIAVAVFAVMAGRGSQAGVPAMAATRATCLRCNEPDPGWAPVPGAPAAVESDAVPVELLPRTAQGAQREAARGNAPPAKHEASQGPSAPATRPDDETAEMRDVAEAERLLAAAPARALVRIEAADARFPVGYLRQEREYVRIMALLELRRIDEARPLATAFLRAYPDGAFARRLRSMTQAANAAP